MKPFEFARPLDPAAAVATAAQARTAHSASTHGRRSSIAFARSSFSPVRRKGAITGNAAPARCM